MSTTLERSWLYVVKPNGGRVSVLRKLFGISRERRNHRETFATTNAEGYTILDTDKLLASEKFRQDAERLKAFAADKNIPGINGTKLSKTNQAKD